MCGANRARERSAFQERERPPFRADDKRASDAERDRVISDLRAHAADGRLSVDELDERIATALAARTRAELAGLLADLPRRPRPVADQRREVRDHVRTYLSVMALLVVIWALTGAGYFWPVWPALGWGIGVMSHVGAVRRAPRSYAN